MKKLYGSQTKSKDRIEGSAENEVVDTCIREWTYRETIKRKHMSRSETEKVTESMR